MGKRRVLVAIGVTLVVSIAIAVAVAVGFGRDGDREAQQRFEDAVERSALTDRWDVVSDQRWGPGLLPSDEEDARQLVLVDGQSPAAFEDDVEATLLANGFDEIGAGYFAIDVDGVEVTFAIAPAAPGSVISKGRDGNVTIPKDKSGMVVAVA